MSESQPLLRDASVEEGSSISLADEVKPEQNYFSDVPNFFWIELSLLLNVFLAGFDGTITASTYATIGSEFKAFSSASWITSSYLITSTAFQPLYGSISDSVGRRMCIVFALLTFGIGCYGCSISKSMGFLIASRAFTGIGGGGLISLSTITNSDIIYPSKRGLFQAVQNLLLGTGAVCGATFGGFLTNCLGWRWCFGLQILPTALSLFVAIRSIPNQITFPHAEGPIYKKIDFKGSACLVVGLTCSLLVLCFGGNELQWTDWRIWVLVIVTVASTVIFFEQESHTEAIPIIPVNDYKSGFVVINIIFNFCVGLASYSYLFTLPLLFQINLGDSVAQVGFRLSIPAVATPLGGFAAGYLITKSRNYSRITILGTTLMAVGNGLSLLISEKLPKAAINLFLFPANFGQGLAFPSSLFLFVYYFDATKQASSTSTVYLMRNIGGVWGVTYISIVIKTVLKQNLPAHLAMLHRLSKEEIDRILAAILESVDILGSVDSDVKEVLVQDYTFALRITQAVSTACCVIALFCAIMSRKGRSYNC